MHKALGWVGVVAVSVLAGCAPGVDVEASPSDSESAVASDVAVGSPQDQLTLAIEAGDADAAAQAIADGALPEGPAGTATPPLYVAATRADVAVVVVLLEAGADVDAPGPLGITPLMAAAQGEGGELVTILLDAGADPNKQDGSATRRMASHVAAQEGNIGALDALFAAGVSIEQLEATDGTPLIYAGYFGQLDAARHLVELGAVVDHRDNANATAAEWALYRGFPEVAAYLDTVAP